MQTKPKIKDMVSAAEFVERPYGWRKRDVASINMPEEARERIHAGWGRVTPLDGELSAFLIFNRNEPGVYHYLTLGESVGHIDTSEATRLVYRARNSSTSITGSEAMYPNRPHTRRTDRMSCTDLAQALVMFVGMFVPGVAVGALGVSLLRRK